MKASDCFSPGFIVKPHGLKGAVVVKFTVKNPASFSGLDAFFLEQRGQLVPYIIESFSVKDSTAYIKFEGVENSEQALELRYVKLFLPADMAPETSADDPALTIGYQVHDAVSGDLGKIREIMKAGPQETMIIEHEKTDVLIPFVPQMVTKIDHKTRIVHTNCPEGLIDMYLGE
jgi:16S rRNA processing protein RimM